MNTSIIFGVLWIVTIVMAGVYVKAKHAIEKHSSYYDAFLELQNWASIVVRWAQDRLSDQMGYNRRLAAVNALKEIRDKMGIDISDDQIGMLISAAYKVMASEELPVEVVSEPLPMPNLDELELGALESTFKDEKE